VDPALKVAGSLLRFGLAAIFFWLGAVKLMGDGPLVETLKQSIPLLASKPYLQLLGLAEIVIAVGLMVDKLSRAAAATIMINLVLITCILIGAPALVFADDTRQLTGQGAYLLNHLLFGLAGLLMLGRRRRAER
jgi:uncharacterized membrane protein YphA (DoxX/SURF4 family)